MQSGLKPGSAEWLMALRVYYAKDGDVVQLIELYDAAQQELERYRRIFKQETVHGTSGEGTGKDDEWSTGG
jgi:hypothetical protein